MAEQRLNRNYLIVGGLALATLAAFWLIENPPGGSKQRSEETTEIVQDLNQEILELESSIMELELVYSTKDAELDQSQQLLQQKNARLSVLEQRIDSLERKGELDEATIRRLRETIERVRQVSQSRDQVNTLVQDISYLTRNTDSLEMTVGRKDSLLRDALALIERYKEQLRDCGSSVPSQPLSEAEIETEPRMWLENLKIYNEQEGGKREEVQGDIDPNRIGKLIFCFDLKANQLVSSGEKDIYLLLRRQAEPQNPLTNSLSGQFTLSGSQLPYTQKALVNYRKGKPLNDVCMDFQHEGEYKFGLHYAELYANGVLLDSRRIFVR